MLFAFPSAKKATVLQQFDYMEVSMSEIKNGQDTNENSVAETPDTAPATDPFASLNKMLEENPEFKSTYESVMSILGDDLSSEEGTEVECVEIDGHDYIIAKKIEIAGTTYLYLINEDDVMDFIIQKIVVKDGEEYITGLDSDREFDLVQAYMQRDFFMQLKGKLKSDSEGKPDNQ